MDDERIWGSEEGLWTGSPENNRATISDACLMVLPAAPFIVTGQQAADLVSNTPRWNKVTFGDRKVARPQEGLIIIAYKALAERENEREYEAYCTTVYRRLEHEKWLVIQHQQTPSLNRPSQI